MAYREKTREKEKYRVYFDVVYRETAGPSLKLERLPLTNLKRFS